MATTDEFFKINKSWLDNKLKHAQTTRRHMFAQLYIGEYFIRYGDGASVRRLIENPKFEYPMNGDWCTDIYTVWGINSHQFTEIIEVQSEYMWNISFKSAEEGVKIVKALQKEGYFSEKKARDYLRNYIICIRKHEITNKHTNSYIGHIAFKCDNPLWGHTVGDWEINNESDLERKIRNVTTIHPYKKSTDTRKIAPFDYLSFAVPWCDFKRFSKDITLLQNDNIRIGCLYAYHNQVLVEFDKQAKEQVKIIGRNGNKKRKGRKLKYNNAKQELEELEKEMDKYRRNELVNFMDTVFVDLRVPHADRPALCLDRASNSGSKPESVPKTGRKS